MLGEARCGKGGGWRLQVPPPPPADVPRRRLCGSPFSRIESDEAEEKLEGRHFLGWRAHMPYFWIVCKRR